MSVHVLAIGAHPDDVELGVGGTVHKLTQRGYSVAILDLTQGEMGTRGSVAERAEEGKAAARILGVAVRECAGLPDGGLANTTEQQRRIIPFIRKHRPAMLLIPKAPDRHPDHAAAHGLARDANYFSGLERIETGEERHRTPRAYFYNPYFESEMPSLIVDISDHFEAKLEALGAHASQFHNPDYPGKETFISSRRFWESITTRAAYWGQQIGAAYGEPLFSEAPIALDLPLGLGPIQRPPAEPVV